jgi:DNA-binding PadR family transcriptional regulator
MSKRPSLRSRRRRAAVLGVLAEHGPARLAAICSRIGWHGSVWPTLERLHADGLVTRTHVEQDGTLHVRWGLTNHDTAKD